LDGAGLAIHGGDAGQGGFQDVDRSQFAQADVLNDHVGGEVT
jgi:hypothetical protein